MKKLFFFAFAAFALAACSDDDNDGGRKTGDFDVISFEANEGLLDPTDASVVLGDVTIVGSFAGGDFSNVFCGKEFMTEKDSNGDYFDGVLFTSADKKIGFGSYFTNNSSSEYVADVWGGFVLSQNFSKILGESGPDYSKEGFSAWATTGANGSKTFAIAYDNGYGDYNYHTPKIEFAKPRKVAYLYLANATVAAQYTSPVDDYWFKVVITGYGKDEAGQSEEKTSVEQILASGRSITDNWIKVDCSSLGEVSELRFAVESNDRNDFGVLCPAYFCIDEIALQK